MAHHEAAGRLAEELERARQQYEQQQQRRDIEARGRHRGTMPMADLDHHAHGAPAWLPWMRVRQADEEHGRQGVARRMPC